MSAHAHGIAVEEMRPDDWDRVAAIDAEGIATGLSTFETEVPPWERWDHDHLDEGRLVAQADGEVLGWAALTRVSIREVKEAGFRVVGRRERLGQRDGRWPDVLLLERRAPTP